MSLPTTPQTRQSISVQPQQARVLLVGTPKSGKTTLLANWAPATTLIIDTQHGTDLLDGEHFVAHVRDWPSFCAVVKDLATTRHPFRTVGIDLIDDVWKFADAHFHGKGSPLASATNDFQKSLNTAEGMFRIEVGKLLASSLGVWFLSHADEKGDPVRYVSKLDKKVLSWVQGATQFVFLAEALGTGGRRQLHTQPSASFEAGSRVPMPEPMDLDARALWLAMDRGLNPHLYTPEAIAAREAAKNGAAEAAASPEPPPAPEPAAAEPATETAAAEPAPPAADTAPADTPTLLPTLLPMETAERIFRLTKALLGDKVLTPAQVKMHLVAAGATDTTSVGAAIDTLTAEAAAELEAAFLALLPAEPVEPVPAEATA